MTKISKCQICTIKTKSRPATFNVLKVHSFPNGSLAISNDPMSNLCNITNFKNTKISTNFFPIQGKNTFWHFSRAISVYKLTIDRQANEFHMMLFSHVNFLNIFFCTLFQTSGSNAHKKASTMQQNMSMDRRKNQKNFSSKYFLKFSNDFETKPFPFVGNSHSIIFSFLTSH